MIGEPWEKVIEDSRCGEIRDIAHIAVKDFAHFHQMCDLELVRVEDAEYTADFACFVLYNLNIFVRCPNKYERIIQSMVWRGLIYEKTEISRLGTRLPPGDMRESSRNLTRQRPDLKEFAWYQLLDKLEDMGLSIDHPTNTLMPVLAWESRPLDRRDIGAGFDERIEHSIIVRVKPPRGKKSKPGLHGLWRLTTLERKWIQTLRPELTDRLKKGIREGQKKTYPPRTITYDEKTGRPVCAIKALVHLDPACLETPRIVTLALFALDNHNRKTKGFKLKFERVVDAMLRTGFMYLLTLEACDEENITHIFMTSVTVWSDSGRIETTPLVRQKSDLAKETKQLFELGESTGTCCNEEKVAE
ncbi:hypothetical protein ACHQM5_014817 [Ranunculus cassubicifolius]